jgi:phosphate transport system substrate-binding protein
VRNSRLLTLAATVVLAVGVGACGGGGGESGGSADDPASLTGEVIIDGSSTVAPLSEPIGAMFGEETEGGVAVSVGTSGTGGGFEAFCSGDTDISDASRVIAPEEEEVCAENGVEYEEIAVANDALTVVVNPDNPITCISPDQLNQIYGEDSDITSWGDIEGLEEDFDADLEIFSPGADSGTFDYFTEAVNEEEGVQRMQGINIVGENDNATVTGVAGSEGGIGYFGFSFFNENREQLKALEIENEEGECIEPTEETQSGEYNPLGRQLFIYPSAEALERPEVQAFVDYYLENVNDVTEQAGFIPLTDEQLEEARDNVAGQSEGGGGSEEESGGSEETE